MVSPSSSHHAKNEVFIRDFFSKCDQIWRKLLIWSYLQKKSSMENFIFCAVSFNRHIRIRVSVILLFISSVAFLKIFTLTLLKALMSDRKNLDIWYISFCYLNYSLCKDLQQKNWKIKKLVSFSFYRVSLFHHCYCFIMKEFTIELTMS